MKVWPLIQDFAKLCKTDISSFLRNWSRTAARFWVSAGRHDVGAGQMMQTLMAWALIIVVIIAPIPFGGNRPLPWSLLAVAIGGLLTFWSLHRLITGQSLPVPAARVSVPFCLFGLTCLWVLIQIMPGMPPGIAHPGWQELNQFFSSDVPGRISVDPDWGLTVMMRWLTYAGTFWLALQLFRDRALATTALKIFAVASLGYALYGIIALYALDDTILLYEKWVGKGSVTSTFVNRNSYATFAGLGILTIIALILSSDRRRTNRSLPLRIRFESFISQSLSNDTPLYVALFVVGTASVLTGSRAGVVSTFAAMLVLFWPKKLRGKEGASVSRLGYRMLAGGVIFVAIAGLSSQLLSDRMMRLGSGDRPEVYRQTVTAIEDHSLLGSGLGSFPQIFQLYRASESLRTQFVEKAHNTYLENALELGLPAALMLFAANGVLVFYCWAGVVSRKRDQHFALLGLSTSVLVGLHSLVDFSLQIPATTTAYYFLLGIGVAQSFSTQRR